MESSGSQPDRIIVNARILTVDTAFRMVEGAAIAGGRFVAVGTSDEIREQAGPETIVDDLDGAIVLPGLIDAHNHLLSTSRILRQVALYDCRSIDDVLERVAQRVASVQPGEWIVGRGWDESLLDQRRHPTRWELDRVAPDNPVVLNRVWNKLVANSAALAAAGIKRETPDPPKGERYAGGIDRDPETGEPAGLFWDRAKEMILGTIPEPSQDELVDALAAGCQAYHAVGIVSVAEPGLHDLELAVYRAARAQGRLSVRTNMLLGAWGYVPAARESELKPWIREMRAMRTEDDDLLRIDGVKFMLDGGVGDRTARTYEPYLDEPDNHGQFVVDPDAFPELIRFVHDLGWSIDVHTCGDAAQDLAVQSLATAMEAAPNPEVQHRVHHAYFPRAATMTLMAKHGIAALVSSPFLVHLGESFVASVGEARAACMMPMTSYLRRRVPLAGTSDSPVADYNPWVGMYGAISRTTVTGRALDPSERIGREDAIRCYTRWAAAATGDSDSRGSIEPGKLADLIVIDRDPLAASDEEIRETRVLKTMVGGDWVWEQEA